MRVTLDTNLLVYAFSERGVKHSAATDLLQRAAGNDCVQPMQTFGEFFHVVTRKHRCPAEDAVGAVVRFRAILDVTAAEEQDFDQALRISVRHRAPFWDALIWATARRAGSRMMLTEDLPGITDLDGLSFVNPFDPGNERLLRMILPAAVEH
jgi:predicted nucleic acid-binding protein